MNPTFLENLRANPFVGILRGLPADQVLNCAKACVDAGLTCIEIPLNTPGATQVLAALKRECASLGIAVGAGTVRTDEDLAMAIDAGADFIVSPNTNESVIHTCVARELPCFPGALTPTEIQHAYALGATAVKVFPIGAMGGVSYVKELRGPFKDIPLLACGGVSESNAAEFLRAGCDFLAFGGSIFQVALMKDAGWDAIAEKILNLRAAAGFDGPAGPR